MIEEQQPQATGQGFGPATGAIVAQGAIAATQAITRGGPRRQYKWNKRAAEDTNAMNRENAIWALEENKKLQNEQRIYDSPAAQMARYKAAGLNPHLIYGSGSSAGSAFPISTQGIGPSRIDAPNASYPDVAGSFLQAGQTLAQTGLTNAKQEESISKMSLMDAQTALLKNNPYYDAGSAQALTSSMMAVARAKEQDANWATQTVAGVQNGNRKLDAALQSLFNKNFLEGYSLESAGKDVDIKAQILKSKEFENEMNDLKRKFMQDGDISPGMIIEFLKSIFLKAM